MVTEVLWWIFAIAIVGVSVGVVTSRSVIHSAIFLILSLAGVGAMYIFLMVEFVALVQFLIYGGAVTVLILLAVMLTRMGAGGVRERVTGPQAPFAVVVGLALLAVLVASALDTNWPGAADAPVSISITHIGDVMFQDFGAAFILIGVLLLIAFVGAIILARQEDGE